MMKKLVDSTLLLPLLVPGRLYKTEVTLIVRSATSGAVQRFVDAGALFMYIGVQEEKVFWVGERSRSLLKILLVGESQVCYSFGPKMRWFEVSRVV